MKTELFVAGVKPITMKQAERLIVKHLGDRARLLLLPAMLRRSGITGRIKDADGDRLYRAVAWPDKQGVRQRRRNNKPTRQSTN